MQNKFAAGVDVHSDQKLIASPRVLLVHREIDIFINKLIGILVRGILPHLKPF